MSFFDLPVDKTDIFLTPTPSSSPRSYWMPPYYLVKCMYLKAFRKYQKFWRSIIQDIILTQRTWGYVILWKPKSNLQYKPWPKNWNAWPNVLKLVCIIQQCSVDSARAPPEFVGSEKRTERDNIRYKVLLKVRQIRNNFFKPTFLLLVDLFSFIFWKNVKTFRN